MHILSNDRLTDRMNRSALYGSNASITIKEERRKINMKKLISMLCATAVMAACVVMASASYATDPEYVAPETPAPATEEEPTKVVDAEIVEERVAEGEAVFLKPVADEPVEVDKSTLAVIAQAAEPVTFVNVETAVTLTIDPAKMTEDAKPVDLNIPVAKAADYSGLEVAPRTHGAYGFTISMQIPRTAFPTGFDFDNAVCYYVDNNKYTRHNGFFGFIGGNFFFEFDHASSYLISDDPTLAAEVGPAGDETTEAEPEEVDPSEEEEGVEVAEEPEEEITEEVTEEVVDVVPEETTVVEETTTAAAEETEAPAAAGDTSAAGNPKTGVTLAIGTVIVAGSIAIATKKRK
jgi:hypothetical protein